MQFSNFGRKITTDPSIVELMDDLGNALAKGDHVAMLGGGNPAAIPEVQSLFETHMARLLANRDEFRAAITNYDPPQGHPAFIQAIVKLLNDQYGWGITPANVTITAGSQTGFFTLFNLLAGESTGGTRRILFPLTPEYIGYADQGITDDMFVSAKPRIETRGDHGFKYMVDFDHLKITPDIAAICVSRPTNPTGNVITNEELQRLSELADAHDIPLIIDNAYGQPFPGVITGTAQPIFNDNIVLSMSLSKVGLPSSRVGIFVSSPGIAAAMAKANTVMSLASPTLGQALAKATIADGSLIKAARDHIQPHYRRLAEYGQNVLARELDGTPYRVHEYEGAYFFWLWLPNLPITSRELYTRLKARGVIVVPGEYFFPGLTDRDWRHQHECLRLNFARPQTEIDAGVAIIGEEVKRAYSSVTSKKISIKTN
ncbi:MAG: valine--pyruvate transaminase [Candidatus Saccharibacteria bacterium]|jgi:valine--pyruvate aminotransferase|nr:valine--pyruvate transaminase [Candidatus Saccharibacteria bacterium]